VAGGAAGGVATSIRRLVGPREVAETLELGRKISGSARLTGGSGRLAARGALLLHTGLMPLTIAVGQHFACLVLPHASVDPQLDVLLDLGEGTWALRRRFFNTPGYDLLYGHLSGETQGNTLFIAAVAATDDNTPCANYWFRPLEERLDALMTGLIIQGVPVFKAAHRLSACGLPGGTRMHSIEPIFRFSDEADIPLAIQAEQLRVASRIGAHLRHLFTPPFERYRRLKSGLHRIFSAVRENSPGEMLHAYVRAMDAVFDSRDERDFARMALTFVTETPQAENVLREIYRLRNLVEHHHPWERAFSSRTTVRHPLELAYLRLKQIAMLTHHVYYGLFDLSARLCDLFIDERHAREFWKKRTDEERRLAWKWPPCDIMAVTRDMP
jgi:hypothetical protein